MLDPFESRSPTFDDCAGYSGGGATDAPTFPIFRSTVLSAMDNSVTKCSIIIAKSSNTIGFVLWSNSIRNGSIIFFHSAPIVVVHTVVLEISPSSSESNC
jgi:hypothetical protein